MNLAENIYRHRSANNLSQAELADALEVSHQSVSKWETGASIPELDKLIKMSKLFGVSIDELVFGEGGGRYGVNNTVIQYQTISMKNLMGVLLLGFGMILFLLSIFWGNHLYFGEAVGELSSAVIVLVSLSILTTYNGRVLFGVAAIYFLYSVVCYAIMNVSSLSNYIFLAVSGVIILVWFILWGENAQKKAEESDQAYKIPAYRKNIRGVDGK